MSRRGFYGWEPSREPSRYVKDLREAQNRMMAWILGWNLDDPPPEMKNVTPKPKALEPGKDDA